MVCTSWSLSLMRVSAWGSPSALLFSSLICRIYPGLLCCKIGHLIRKSVRSSLPSLHNLHVGLVFLYLPMPICGGAFRCLREDVVGCLSDVYFASTQRANVRTMYVHCTYKPVHTDLVRITFGMKVFWTYGSVRT